MSAKIIRQVCYPKALYGGEILGKLTKTETLMLERTHHYVCKFIQGLHRRTRTDMCLSLIGWFNLNSFINETFFGRTVIYRKEKFHCVFLYVDLSI